MAKLYIVEDYVNETENLRYRGSGDTPIETWTDDIKQLYHSLVSEHGKAKNLYVDKKDGSTHKAGWVFTKRKKYDDCNESYLASTWVTVLVKNENGKFVTYPFK